MMHPDQLAALQRFDQTHIGESKGALSFVVTITRNLREKTFPVSIDDYRTAEEGQVKGLGGGAIRSVLRSHGIHRVLSTEGGRTSRGNMGRLRAYLELLTDLWNRGILDLEEAEKFWIDEVRSYFDNQPFTFKLDPTKSLRTCVRDVLTQAIARQRQATGTMYAGAVMQHLVGAKLDLITGGSVLEHHGFAVADAPSNRSGDFFLGDVAVHVTTSPSEALMTKIQRNLQRGLRPLIVTTEDGVGGAKAVAKLSGLEERLDIIEIEQFLATNIYEWSAFKREERSLKVKDLIERYNQLVTSCETDPSLRIEFDG